MPRKPPLRPVRFSNLTPKNGEFAELGTACANYTNVPSCEHLQPKRVIQGVWDGARNSALRTSETLTDRQVEGLLESARYALANNRVFQRHWIVHYGKAGIAPENATKFVSRLLDQVSKQARREGGEMTALWVRERASGKGEHLHVLLHLPTAMRLRGRTRRWVVAAGGSWQPGISKIRIIGGRLSKAHGNSDAVVRDNAANVLRYLLKAADNETGERLSLPKSGKTGTIIGKRCGWTQNIGRAARKDS